MCVASLGILKLTRADFVTIFADDRLMDVLDVCPPVVRMFKSYYDRDFGTSLRIMSGVTVCLMHLLSVFQRFLSSSATMFPHPRHGRFS